LANDRRNNQDYAGSIRRISLVVLVSILLLFFAIWRIDNPRIERLRADVIDTIIPHFEWVLRPATWAGRVLENFQSYQALYQQNQELNRELQKMKSWKEAALQLEQENARRRLFWITCI
jgi:rod shape-determining protein MreC